MANPAVITSRSMPHQVAKEMDDIYRVNLAEWDSEYDKVLKVQSAPAGPHYYQSEITGLDSLPAEISEVIRSCVDTDNSVLVTSSLT